VAAQLNERARAQPIAAKDLVLRFMNGDSGRERVRDS
jgi:hypothetical protein